MVKLGLKSICIDSQASGDRGGRPGEVGEADSGIGEEGEVKGVKAFESSIPQERHRLRCGHEIRAAVEAGHPECLN